MIQVDRLDMTDEVSAQASISIMTSRLELPPDHLVSVLQMRKGTEVFSSAMDTAKVAIAKKKELPPKEENTVLRSMTPKTTRRNMVAKAVTHMGIVSQIHSTIAEKKIAKMCIRDRRKAHTYKILCVAPHCLHSFFLQIIQIRLFQRKPAPEG